MRMRERGKRYLRHSIIALVFVSAITLGRFIPVAATTLNWVGTTLQYSEIPDQGMFPPKQVGGCVQKTMTLTVARGAERQVSICLNVKDGWSYGKYSYNERTWWGGVNTIHGYAVRLAMYGDMHRLTQNIPEPNISVPNSNDIITLSRRADINNYLHVYKDFKAKLVKVTEQDGEVQYSYDTTPDFTLGQSDGADVAVYNRPGISNNGKWVVAETNLGFVRINLITFETKRFTPLTYTYTVGYGPSTQFAITNDGKHVAVMGGYHTLGSHPGYRLYDIPDSCGDTMSEMIAGGKIIDRPCPKASFESVLREHYSSQLDYATNPSFDNGGGQLTVQAFTMDHSRASRWVQLTVEGYTPLRRIAYLALGDSYSSGEGDITASGAHYLSGTAGEHGCHISDRSYPFLLRDNYGIQPQNMESVACSGAQVSFDYMGDDTNYSGQNNRLQKQGLQGQALKREQTIALDNFAPGEVKQIDFVRKYKPSVVTLTGGGNDVGFAKILEYCASPHLSDFDFIVHQSCGYAIKGSELETMLYDSIDSQYSATKLLIAELQEASPNTKFIIVGYPSFIDAGSAVCNPNDGLLDSNERAMIQNALEYMNKMLKRAAHDTSVSYADIEDSLEGGRICEGGEYVNGAWGNIVGTAEDHDRFHPNSSGHIKIAETIEESHVFTETKIPPEITYSPSIDSILTLPVTFLDDTVSLLKPNLKIAMTNRRFKPGTSVSITLHSKLIDLGTFKTDKDGNLFAQVSIKGVQPGQHVLVAEGTGLDGKPVRYYQFITVIARQVDDGTENNREDLSSDTSAISMDKARSRGMQHTNAANEPLAQRNTHGSQEDSRDPGNEKSLSKNLIPMLVYVSATSTAIIVIIGAIYYYDKQK